MKKSQEKEMMIEYRQTIVDEASVGIYTVRPLFPFHRCAGCYDHTVDFPNLP